jgi:hypothetical protein
MRATASLLTALLMLTACGSKTQQADTTGANKPDSGVAAGEALGADPVNLPLKEFMAHVMQFAGQSVWKWQGTVTDAKGEHDLSPKTEDDWYEAESAALTLAEVTNLLMMPNRRVDDPRWDKSVALVRDVALREAAAAAKKDYKTYFEVGGELDGACESCHVHFAPGYTAPPELKLETPPNQKKS